MVRAMCWFTDKEKGVVSGSAPFPPNRVTKCVPQLNKGSDSKVKRVQENKVGGAHLMVALFHMHAIGPLSSERA